jgi:hypothetical protein
MVEKSGAGHEGERNTLDRNRKAVPIFEALSKIPFLKNDPSSFLEGDARPVNTSLSKCDCCSALERISLIEAVPS